jgi:Dolichyl-phosphate-mannose-protein mannosyltransferase
LRTLPARAGVLAVRPRHALALVSIVFVTLALLVAVLTPPWEASDEPSHVQNVEALAAGHLYRIKPGSGVEPHQPPLYYAGLAAWQRLVSLAPFRPAPVVGCNFFFQRCRLLYRHDVPTDGRDQRRVTLLRLPGVLLGLVTVLLTAVAARRLSRDRWTPVVAAATVAFVPRFVFLSGVVTNDNLADALGAAGTVLAISILMLPAERRRTRLWMAFGLGLVVAGLILTKETALALVPGLLLAAYLAGRERYDGLRLVGIALAVGIVASSPWLLFNSVEYGDPLALKATHEYLSHIGVVPGHGALIFVVGPAAKVLLVTMPKEIYKGFWYRSGWTSFSWGWGAYLPFWIFTAGALAGLTRRARGRWTHEGSPEDAGRRALIVLAILVLVPIATVWLLGLETNTSQARLAFVGLPALGCLVALGLERWPMPVAVRFALPLLGAVATMVAIRNDVVSVPPRPLPRAAAVRLAQVADRERGGRRRDARLPGVAIAIIRSTSASPETAAR